MFKKRMNNSGTLDLAEFASMDCHRGMPLSKIQEAFERLDVDGDNTLTMEEFAKYRVRNLLKLNEHREQEERKEMEESKSDLEEHSREEVVRLTEETINRFSFGAGAKHNLF